MPRPPYIPFNGAIGRAFKQVWDAIDALQPRPSPGMLTNRTTRGTTRTPIRKESSAGSFVRLAYVIAETEQWLKCQFPDQLDTEDYIWVAKPKHLRSASVVDTANFDTLVPDIEWQRPFAGEVYIYRTPFERICRTSLDASSTRRIGLAELVTNYEKWSGSMVYDDLQDYIGSHRNPSLVGLVDWVWDYQMVWPRYGGLEGAPIDIYITPLDENDLPSEEPDDETWEPPFYTDLNQSARRWVSTSMVQPDQLIVHAQVAPPYGALASRPQQYTDQTFGNANPALRGLLATTWVPTAES